jgi:tetratricopeptide (TPR) repeat protein
MLGKLYASEKHEYAEDYYDNALRIKPNSIEAIYNKAIYLQSIEEYEEAYFLYDQIIELDSASYFAYYNKGYIMLISDSSYSGAIKEFEKSLRFYPYYFQAFYNIGLCYENQGDYEKAKEYYSKSLEINPQYDLAAYGLSRLLE